MIDIQRVQENRGITLEKVGIKHLHYPIHIQVKGESVFQTPIASVELAVEVPADVKATHMSRFTQIVHKYKDEIQGHRFLDIIRNVRSFLEAPRAYGKFSFPYYVEKNAPISRESSLMEYLCEIEGAAGSDKDELYLTVTVPVATLCPCSKAISDMGAHNQRADVRVKADVSNEFLWIEDIIKAVEDSASAPLYALLKRVDEKHITEQAYNNPRFVEDVVREVYLRLEKLYRNPANCGFCIECESYESIHNHSAFAATRYRPPASGAAEL